STLEMVITVDLGPRSYSIVGAAGALGDVGSRLRELRLGSRAALVSDAAVGRLYRKTVTSSLEAAGFSVAAIEVPEGEGAKTLEVAERCWNELLAAGLDRTSTVLALGGGAVGDVAGFAAATYMRGVNVVQLPTTVLAQVDASIGGKTAIDHPLAKNLIGAFHQPRLVIVDPAVARTLPEREFRSGLAEIVKHGIVLDAGYFAELERDLARQEGEGRPRAVRAGAPDRNVPPGPRRAGRRRTRGHRVVAIVTDEPRLTTETPDPYNRLAMPGDDQSIADAIRRQEERLARDPASLAFAQLADLYRKAGRTRDAVALCRDGLARYPHYTTARLILAKALAAAGDL